MYSTGCISIVIAFRVLIIITCAIMRGLKDESHRAVIGKIVPDPINEDGNAIAETHQRQQMQAKPRDPGEEAAQLDAVEQKGNRAVATNRRHDAPVDVMEILLLPARD